MKIKFLFVLLFLTNLIFGQKSNDILPVELIYFEASLISNGILLRWGTATEVNNYGFEIQRANSSFNFVGIDFVQGSGNSNSPKHYFYVDTSLVDYGLYHYRLKIIDIDGYFEYSDTVNIYYQTSVVAGEESINPLNVNIINDSHSKELIIKLNDKNKFDDLSASIFNILGEEIFFKTLTNNSSSFKINYSYFPSGIYLISLISKNKILTSQKFIVLH